MTSEFRVDFSDDDSLLVLAEVCHDDEDLLNEHINSHSLSRPKNNTKDVSGLSLSPSHEIDAYIGEISMLKHLISIKDQELNKIKQKSNEQENNIKSQFETLENSLKAQLKNLQTQLLFKQQEIDETRKANMIFQSQLENTKSMMMTMNKPTIKHDCQSSTHETSNHNTSSHDSPSNHTISNLNFINDNNSCNHCINIEQLYEMFNNVVFVVDQSPLSRYLLMEFFNIHDKHTLLMIIIICLANCLDHCPNLILIIKIYDTLSSLFEVDDYCSLFCNNDLFINDFKLPNGHKLTNLEFHQSKQKILMNLKSEIKAKNQNKIFYHLICQISQFNSKISNYIIEDLQIESIIDFCLVNKDFDILSILVNCKEICLKNFPCSQSHDCGLNEIICKMNGSDILYIKSVLKYILNILTSANYGPKYIIMANCLCNINLYESIFGSLFEVINDFDDEIAILTSTIITLCYDQETFLQRIENSFSQYCLVYFKLLNHDIKFRHLTKTLDSMWIFDINKDD